MYVLEGKGVEKNFHFMCTGKALKISHIISVLKRFIDVGVHVVMVESHEESVDDNAQGHEEVHERIKDDERQILKKEKLNILLDDF